MRTLVSTCVSASERDVCAYDDTEREITYRTFAKNVGRETIKELNESFSVPLSRDWAVSFGKGIFRGKLTYVLHHSSVHHFFQ